MDKDTTIQNDSQWPAVLESIKGSLTKGQYDTHFLGSAARFDGSTCEITLPASGNVDMVRNQLKSLVERKVTSVYRAVFDIEFVKTEAQTARTIEQSMSTVDDSDGFDMPLENWSKLPHSLIAQFDKIRTASELKVILYILRHTWGFQDDWKRIAMDEFVNGRRTNNPKFACHCDRCQGLRMDHGVSMAAKNIRDGLKRAIEHKFINVEVDDSDKARIKKFYSVNYRK